MHSTPQVSEAIPKGDRNARMRFALDHDIARLFAGLRWSEVGSRQASDECG